MYVGVDYQKKYLIATKMDEKGRILKQVRLSNDPQDISEDIKNTWKEHS